MPCTFTGFKKKLMALAKDRECAALQPWVASVVNHIYWCASSTEPGQPDTIIAKWLSILNHMANIHIHDDERFPRCLHGILEGREAQKQWLQPCKSLWGPECAHERFLCFDYL